MGQIKIFDFFTEDINERLRKIRNGASFGEYSVYDDAIFPYEFLEIIDDTKGKIKVMDVSQKERPIFVTNVNDVSILEVDAI